MPTVNERCKILRSLNRVYLFEIVLLLVPRLKILRGLFLGNSTALLCLFVSQNPKSKIPIDKPRRIFRRGTNNNTISKT